MIIVKFNRPFSIFLFFSLLSNIVTGEKEDGTQFIADYQGNCSTFVVQKVHFEKDTGIKITATFHKTGIFRMHLVPNTGKSNDCQAQQNVALVNEQAEAIKIDDNKLEKEFKFVFKPVNLDGNVADKIMTYRVGFTVCVNGKKASEAEIEPIFHQDEYDLSARTLEDLWTSGIRDLTKFDLGKSKWLARCMSKADDRHFGGLDVHKEYRPRQNMLLVKPEKKSEILFELTHISVNSETGTKLTLKAEHAGNFEVFANQIVDGCDNSNGTEEENIKIEKSEEMIRTIEYEEEYYQKGFVICAKIKGSDGPFKLQAIVKPVF